MKNLSTLFLAAVLMAGCGEVDKKAQLEDLKKQLAEINSQIKKIENELAAKGEKEEAKGKMVSTTLMAASTFQHYVEVQGSVDAEENVGVSAQAPGVVSAIYVSVGQMVTKGQRLAETNNKAIMQQIEALKKQLELATSAYEKQKTLWDKKIGSEMQYLQAKTQKETLEKQISSLREQGDVAVIESPINGVVDAVNAKVGQATAPGYPAFQVVNLSTLKVKGEVPEKYASQIKIGGDVVLYFPDLKKEVNAKVTYAAKVINALSRTFTVEVKLTADNAEFHPNMIAVLKIVDYKSEGTMVVPTDVVQQSESGSFVLVAIKEKGKNIVKKKVVEVGLSYNGNTEILKGLATGETVITRGYQNVNEGDEIQL